MISVMETGKYVIMVRPAKEKVVADLNAFATGNFENFIRLEHVKYDDTHDEKTEGSEDENDQNCSVGAADALVQGEAECAQENAAASGEAIAGGEAVVGGEAARTVDDEVNLHEYSIKQINKLLESELGEWMMFLR